MSTCTPTELDRILSTCDRVLEEDLEALRRLYTREELIEEWNRVRAARRMLREKCLTDLHGHAAARRALGKCTLAMLLVAAALRGRGDEIPGVTDVFSPEEYRIIEDLEKYKVFDYLDIDEIVEYIERREGKVYEFVKEYYAKQYNALDKVWAPLLGDLMGVIEERYRDRRRKLEEAVKRYIEKHGLLATMLEIEDALEKARKLEETRIEAERLAEELDRRIEEAAEDPETLEKNLEEAAEKLRSILERLGVETPVVKGGGGAAEILRIEAEALQGTMEKLLDKLRQYEALLKRLRLENTVLRRDVERLRLSLEGGGEAPAVSLGVAAALVEAYVSRFWKRLERVPRIYSGLEKKTVAVKRWDEIDYGDAVVGKSYIRAVAKRGLLSRSPRIVVEMRAIYHYDNYAKKGFDDKKATVEEVVGIVSRRLQESVAGNYYTVLILVSPTGFTEKALELVGGGERYRSIYSDNLTLYMVDLSSGRLYYNNVDEAAIRNKWLAEPVVEEEKVAIALDKLLAEDTISNALAQGTPPYISLEELARLAGVDEKSALIAMRRAMDMGRGHVAVLRGGKTVFIYKA